MNLKKTSICVAVIIAFSGVSNASDYKIIISKENNQYEVGEFIPPTQRFEYTEWSNTGLHYDCSSYSPLTTDIYNGTDFTQSRNCSQDQTRTKTTIDVYSDGSEKINKTETEQQTIIESDSTIATGSYLAESCLDILNHGGDQGDGIYEIKNNSKSYNVTCNMTFDGGGWTTFGTNTNYNLLNINDGRYDIEVLSAEDLANISYIKNISTENAVDTDWVVSIQADDSVNPSSFTYKSIDLTREVKVEMMSGWNNTRIYLNFDQNYPRVYCTGTSGTNNCGLLNKPEYNQYSENAFVTNILLDPRGTGASAYSNQWHRNQSTVTGTKFFYMFR
jgi:hypothetical protein